MTVEQVEQVEDRKSLKIQALINKVTKVENENADYQVELHLKTTELQQLQQEVVSLREALAQMRQSADTERLNANNVQEEVPTSPSE